VGVLVDRLGPRRVVMTALAAAASGALLLSRAESAPAAFLARTLTGIAAAAFWPANDSLIASVIPSEQRQRYFGVSFALLNAGIGVGGVMGALFVDVAQPNTFVAVYRADALTFLAPLALLAVPLRHVGGPVAYGHATALPTAGTYGDVLRDRVFRRLLLLSFVSSFVGYGQVEGG
jgi:MFS family permease